MSTTIAPEVAEFAAAVRAQLADLSADEREELAGGLEADLADLVEERGPQALGDPVAYARELRSAAGLDPVMGRVVDRRPWLEVVDGRLDAAHARWEHQVTGLPGSPWEFLVALRPAWWLLRAYVAVQTVDYFVGGSWRMSVLPSMFGLGIPLLVAAAVVSVQIGRGRLWPATPRTVVNRLVLAALNLFAVAMVPVIGGAMPVGATWDELSGYGSYESAVTSGLAVDGRPVTNVYPYDAEGNPLVGVQLFDQRGRPLAVDRNQPVAAGRMSWTYPWSNVNGEVWNAFPMPQARVDQQRCCERMRSPWTSEDPPSLLRPPLDQVPAVTVPEAAYGDEVAPQSEVQEQPAQEPPVRGSAGAKAGREEPDRQGTARGTGGDAEPNTGAKTGRNAGR